MKRRDFDALALGNIFLLKIFAFHKLVTEKKLQKMLRV